MGGIFLLDEKIVSPYFMEDMKICDYRIGFIGFGHMAQVICRGIELSKLIPRSQILFLRRDSHKMRENEKTFGITSTSLKNLVEQSQILILAVRPAQLESILQDLSKLDIKEKKIITIVAGVRIASYQKYLGSDVEILRVMPNIASSIGEGMSVFSFGPHATSEFQSLAKLLFSPLGEVMELKESLMDISCAIAGSGPGFVFRLIEAMARAGEGGGLSYAEALKMSAKVFAGASSLILKGDLPENLIYQIATPGGTTEAGYNVMKETDIALHLQKTVEAAASRSKQLGLEKGT